jgi:hypothetical protein
LIGELSDSQLEVSARLVPKVNREGRAGTAAAAAPEDVL